MVEKLIYKANNIKFVVGKFLATFLLANIWHGSRLGQHFIGSFEKTPSCFIAFKKTVKRNFVKIIGPLEMDRDESNSIAFSVQIKQQRCEVVLAQTRLYAT